MTLLRLIVCFSAVMLGGAAHAQTPSPADSYPSRPVKLIVPYPPGGVTDVLGRLWAQRISQSLGQNVYVDNQGGGGSNLGTGIAARQAPDGYTLLLGATPLSINPSLYQKIPYDPHKDFAPITVLAVTPNIIVVHPSLPAKNLEEFIALIRANPGKYSYAMSGVGTPNHIQAEVFKVALNLDIIPVPFGGGGPAIQSTVAGHTPIAFVTLTPSIQELVAQGQLRALAVTGTKRAPMWPDVPTLAESGIRGQESGMYAGILAPAQTPLAIIEKLHTETAKISAPRR